MDEKKQIVKGQIGNALESVAPDHIVAVSEDIFDEGKQEYQHDINERLEQDVKTKAVRYGDFSPEEMLLRFLSAKMGLLFTIDAREFASNNNLIFALDDKYAEKVADLQNQILSMVDPSGNPISLDFGDNPLLAISQKTLTEAINKIWSKLEEITGERYREVSLNVQPAYYIGEEGCTIHVVADTQDVVGIFEEISFYANGTKVWPLNEEDGKHKYHVEFDLDILETSVLKVVTKILGRTYSEEKIITHYNSYWLGCGKVYTDVMDGTPTHIIPIVQGMRGEYDVTSAEGDYLFVIMGESFRPGFIRADISGIEIPFDEQTVTIDGNNYVIFRSKNTYNAGVMNIDING